MIHLIRGEEIKEGAVNIEYGNIENGNIENGNIEFNIKFFPMT